MFKIIFPTLIPNKLDLKAYGLWAFPQNIKFILKQDTKASRP